MRISKVRITNYKCFFDTGDIDLAAGFNFVVGRNDSGKSAFLEALCLLIPDKPHRSLVTVPAADDQPHGISKVSANHELSSMEMLSALSKLQMIFVPMNNFVDNEQNMTFFNSAVQKDGRFNSQWSSRKIDCGWLEQVGRQISHTYSHFTNLEHPSALQLSVAGHSAGERQDYGVTLGENLARSIYAFRAERLNLGEVGISGNSSLQTNAANLPDVLNQLSTRNPERYERLLTHVRAIFPHITHIAAPIVGGNLAKILVWTVPTKTEREDLAVPLADSGTGIGQVLAMLYVVVMSDIPKIIIIDEPQSFLHPGAVRQLLEILRGYSQHQYVISTHSPFALSMSPTDKILLIRRDGSESQICQINPNSQEELRVFLDDVGARLGDVFGAESILWVEGKTEERCFPELVRRLGGIPLQGVQILGVISTDELGAAKFADRVYDIYMRVSGGPSLLPPAVAFVFDKEGRSDSERNDIERKSKGLVKWLPFRMYENYLLEAAAIVDVLNSVDSNRQTPILESEIDSWLATHGGDKKYFRPNKPLTFENDNWRNKVHGASILHDLFCEMTENRIEYDKVTHGLALTRYLIEHPTTALRELAEFLCGLVKTGTSKSSG